MTTMWTQSSRFAKGAVSVSHSCGVNHVGCLACAGPLFRGVVKALRKEGLQFDQHKLHLSIVDRLDSARSLWGGRVVGLTDIQVMRLATFDLSACASDVRIVRDLRPVQFQTVAAHELGHVWLANRRVLSAPAWCSEGFCELVACRYAEALDSMEAALECVRISSNPDPTYGGGYRRLKALSDQIGFHAVCDALANGRWTSF